MESALNGCILYLREIQLSALKCLCLDSEAKGCALAGNALGFDHPAHEFHKILGYSQAQASTFALAACSPLNPGERLKDFVYLVRGYPNAGVHDFKEYLAPFIVGFW